jgi:type II secretory pathway predicted ATPase ExeA
MAPSKRNSVAHAHEALVLKRVLNEIGLSQSRLSKSIEVPTSTLSEIVNWNNWPINRPNRVIKEAVVAELQKRNVSRETLAAIWNVDTGPALPVSRHASNYGKPRKKVMPLSPLKAAHFFADLPENAMLTVNAKQHFKLFQDPFTDDVHGPSDIFLPPDTNYVKAAMYQTAKRGGFIAVVGESGAGKTTLRKDLCDRVSKEPQVRVFFPRIIDKRSATASSICDAILADFDQKPVSSLEAKARQIEKLLSLSARSGNSHTLVIEEAHDLDMQVLKFLKRFLEIEDGFKRLISVILIGQPELRNKLNEHLHPEIREVSRRCEIIELKPLTTNLKDYLALKFKRVERSVEDFFDKGAIDAIRQRLTISQGQSRAQLNMAYPLIVNNTVTAALNQCAELGLPKITADLIQDL